MAAGVLFVVGSVVFAGEAAAVRGGEDTSTKDYPFAVVITRPESPHPQKVSCGGALVKPSKVLTAAHCVDANSGDWHDKTVIAGRDDLTTTDGVEAKIVEVWSHPDYTPGKLNGDDVAILTLDEDIDAQLATIVKPEDTDVNQPGQDTTLVTYGFTGPTNDDYTSHVQKATLTAVEDAKCTDIGWQFDADKQVCQGPVKGGDVGVCKGDSGAPLVVGDAASGYRIAGLIESGDSQCSGPQVATRLTFYSEQLAEQLG